jgi:protein-S-isoprenylcysteine O-methyltransferase Ste14/rhodanese-related sulfurtransferase
MLQYAGQTVWAMTDSLETDPPRLTAASALAQLRQESAVLIDVRGPHEYEQEHIAGARSLPLTALDPALFPGGKTVIVYCATSKRSCAAAAQLKQAGFTAVAVLEGGIVGWKAVGLPTESTSTLSDRKRLRWLVLTYGVVAYLFFLVSFLYTIGFLGGFLVPKTIDSGSAGTKTTAFFINLGLLALFAAQHTVMARPAFKRWWTRIVPPAMERSTYVLATSAILFLLFRLWRPLPAVVWQAERTWMAVALWLAFGVGWVIVLVSTLQINHFDLFGLRQVYLYFSGQNYMPVPFRTPWLYRVVRHPIMVGFLIAFWATPKMTVGHLLFAAMVTIYVLFALRLEERDLLAHYGETYSAYQRQVRMLLPLPKGAAHIQPQSKTRTSE